jgi:hypothetical protein
MNKNVGIEYVYKKLIENGMETEKAKKIANELQQETDARRFVPREDAPAWGVSIRQASRRYRIPSPTISRWVAKNYIPVVYRDAWITLILECAMAKIASIYHTNPGQGTRTVKRIYEN